MDNLFALEMGSCVEELFLTDNRSVTIVLSKEDMADFLYNTNIEKYDVYNASHDGEYFYITSCIFDDHSALYVENVVNDEGILKYDENDILIFPDYLPRNIKEYLKNDGYDQIVEVNKSSTMDYVLKMIK